jgi:hypothetical protein
MAAALSVPPQPAASAPRLLSSSTPTTAASQQKAPATFDLSAGRRHLVHMCRQGAFLDGSWVEQNVHTMDEKGIRTLLLALHPVRSLLPIPTNLSLFCQPRNFIV